MDFLCLFGGANFPRSDRPHWLVGDHDGAHLHRSDALEIFRQLKCANLLGAVHLLFSLGLANAENRAHARIENLLHLLVDLVVVVFEERSSLRVSAQHIFNSNRLGMELLVGSCVRRC